MSVVASRKVTFIVLRVRNALYVKKGTRLFKIGTIGLHGVTSGERFKKNLRGYFSPKMAEQLRLYGRK